MAALFPRWSNSLVAWMIVLGGASVLGGLTGAWAFTHSPLNTGVGEPLLQPVAFDHRHHVRDDGIDCRYCHYLAEDTPFAGVPPTELCMNCHAQVWTSAPQTEPIRVSYFEDRPIVWRRVHALPDHVFFNHSIHVRRGVACSRCHGELDEETRVSKQQPMTMDWCLECHRKPPAGTEPPTHCSGCHR